MKKVKKINNELLEAYKKLPMDSGVYELWDSIRNDNEVLNEASDVLVDESGKSNIESIIITSLMLEDSLNDRHYEYMDAYIKLVRAIYSEKDIANTLIYGNKSVTYLLATLFNEYITLTIEEKEFAVNMSFEELNSIKKLYDLRYVILINHNWSTEEKLELIKSFWSSEKEFLKYLRNREWRTYKKIMRQGSKERFKSEMLYELEFRDVAKNLMFKSLIEQAWNEIIMYKKIKELGSIAYQETLDYNRQ